MTWEQKSDLIKKDPVTCARNFDLMVQLFICNVLKSNVMPISSFFKTHFKIKNSKTIVQCFDLTEIIF